MTDDLQPPERGTGPAAEGDPKQGSAGTEMAFLDHLEELRWRILKSLAAVLVGAIACFAFSNPLMDLLTRPYKEAVASLEAHRPAGVVYWAEKALRSWAGDRMAPPPPEQDKPLPPGRQLQALRPTTYFMISLQIGLLGGLVLALPVVFYQLWQFVAPGLLRREKRLALPIIALSTACFLLGGLVAYGLVLPVGLRFLLSLEPPGMTSQWAADAYISFVMRTILAFGVVFELPVLALLLARLGLVTAGLMRRVRSYAVVAAFIAAAILTPGPDPLSQILMAVPLLLLYEVSIWVAAVSARRRAARR